MDPDAIERLSPSARVEVQGYYADKFLAESRPHSPERRRAMKIKHRLDRRLVPTKIADWRVNRTEPEARIRMLERPPSRMRGTTATR
jgi:hypothetical protein